MKNDSVVNRLTGCQARSWPFSSTIAGMRRTVLVLFLSVLVLPVKSATAETRVGTSLEWLTIRSTIIAIGLLDYVGPAGQIDGQPVDQWSLSVSEAIKGSVDRKINFYAVRPAGIAKPESTFDTTSEFAIFLSSARGEAMDSSFAGKLMPSSNKDPFAVFDLDKPPLTIFRLTGKQVTSKEELLKAINETKTAHDNYLKGFSPKVLRIYIEMDPNSEAYSSLYSGGKVYMIAPSFMGKGISELPPEPDQAKKK